MKKETIFRHELNESIQANAALNCLKNRNNHKQLNESSDFDKMFQYRPDLRELGTPISKEAYMIIYNEWGDSMWRRLGIEDCNYRGLIDSLNYAQELYGITNPQDLADLELGRTSFRSFKKNTQEQEENTLNAYYSQDEPDYENDHHGIWLIINLMRKMGMLRAQGIEGRDDVDDGHAIDAAYDLIEQKLNDEGMWIGDDDHEAERFVSFYGDEIAEEAMKSAIHNQKVYDMEGSREEYYSQDEPDYDDDSHGIRLILNMLMKRGDITKSDIPKAQKQIKSMLDANGMWIGDDENEAKRFIEMHWDNQEQEELPSMERHDMILALSEYMAESWIATGDDGDLDDIYYAVAEVLDKTGDYPASTNWEDCKPWCQKHYREIEETVLGGGF